MKNKHADIFHRQGKGLIMDELRKQHDDLLANKPEEMSDGEFAALIEDHAKTCPFCNDKLIAEDNNDTDPEGGDMDKTFTQEELDAAVLAAVAPIQAELQSFKDSAVEGEVEARVAEAKAESDAEKADLQAKLDEAVNAKGAAETELANVLAFLATESEAAELAEWFTAIKAERKAQIEEVANFPADYLEANLDRWCEKDDAEFAAMIADWKIASAPKAVEPAGEEAARETAMKNIRPVESGSTVLKGDLANLFGAADAGIDIRKV
jgi:hypothetical protein